MLSLTFGCPIIFIFALHIAYPLEVLTRQQAEIDEKLESLRAQCPQTVLTLLFEARTLDRLYDTTVRKTSGAFDQSDRTDKLLYHRLLVHDKLQSILTQQNPCEALQQYNQERVSFQLALQTKARPHDIISQTQQQAPQQLPAELIPHLPPSTSTISTSTPSTSTPSAQSR